MSTQELLHGYLLAFCIGFACMFVLAVDEIQRFKGCPVPEYFKQEVTQK
jgi:hypothetical protein